MKKTLLVSILLGLFLLSQTSLALAQSRKNSTSSGDSRRSQRSVELKQKIDAQLKESRSKLASRAALKKVKLEERLLKICETKKATILRHMTKLSERAERQLTNFELKANRVDDYYNNKLVPKGGTIDNYDELQANIEAKAQLVTEAVGIAKASAESFDCKGDDPKGQLTNFRTDMKNVITALKDYRSAIKDLIAAVRIASAKVASSSATN